MARVTDGEEQTDFTQIRSTLRGGSSELRGSYKKVSPEMNVSRRVDYRSTQEYYLTSSEKKVTAVRRQQQNRKISIF